MMQVATRFERRQNNAKNDEVVLYCTKYKYTMYIKLLNATVIVFILQLFPIRLTPHSRVAHRYLDTPSLPNGN